MDDGALASAGWGRSVFQTRGLAQGTVCTAATSFLIMAGNTCTVEWNVSYRGHSMNSLPIKDTLQQQIFLYYSECTYFNSEQLMLPPVLRLSTIRRLYLYSDI